MKIKTLNEKKKSFTTLHNIGNDMIAVVVIAWGHFNLTFFHPLNFLNVFEISVNFRSFNAKSKTMFGW